MSDELRRVRVEKRAALREAGIAPYPDRYERTHTIGQAAALPAGTEGLRLAGRLVLNRVMGGLAFAQIRDVTGTIQISLNKGELGAETFGLFKSKLIEVGDFVGVAGALYHTQKGELTLRVAELTFLGKALRPLPEKWHGVTDVDTRYRKRYLDLVMNEETRARFRRRATLVRTLRRVLEENGFEEVETPILQTQASGALARPFATHHRALDLALFLRIAPETYLKRLIAGGYDRVYEVARCFRNEGMDPSHLQEFTMLEFYAAYWSYEDNMLFTERLVKEAVRETTGSLVVQHGGATIDFSGEWPRRGLRDLIVEYAGIDVDGFGDADALRAEIARAGVDIENAGALGRGALIDHLYKKMVRPKLVAPVFVTRHPIELSPLARRNDDDPRRSDRFQLVVNGWEVVNAYSELVDPIDQRARFEEQARLRAAGDEEALEMDEDYVLAMEHGMPPISGWGMGIDRFVALLTGAESLRDTVFFPTMRPLGGSGGGGSDAPAGSVPPCAESVGVDLATAEELAAEGGDPARAHAIGAAMAALAREIDADSRDWRVAGVLHAVDPDRLETIGTTVLLVALAERAAPAGATSRLGLALAACEHAVGLTLASAAVRPDKDLAGLDAASVRKKLAKKGFAAGVDRGAIRAIEKLGLPLDRFLTTVVEAVKG